MRMFQANPTQPGPDADEGPDRRRVYSAELRETQVVGRPFRYLEGRAVPYGVAADIGWYVETHAAASLKKSTRQRPASPLLIAHNNADIRQIAGHAEQWRHEDDGAYGVWKLNDSAFAQQAAKMVDDGDLTGLSIGFQPILSSWEMLDFDEWDPDLGPDHKDRVTRVESRLLEVSLTPTPAFADALVTNIRAASAYTRSARVGLFGELEADRWRARVDEVRAGGRFGR